LLIVAHNRSSEAGFTIIEVLVALALVAASLAAIGSVMATTARGIRAMEQHVALVQTARAVEAGLPPRDELSPGQFGGEISGHRWRVLVAPFATGNRKKDVEWTPQSVTIRVLSPSGALMELHTARLRKRAKK
jgi:general secretion pathway protein I